MYECKTRDIFLLVRFQPVRKIFWKCLKIVATHKRMEILWFLLYAQCHIHRFDQLMSRREGNTLGRPQKKGILRFPPPNVSSSGIRIGFNCPNWHDSDWRKWATFSLGLHSPWPKINIQQRELYSQQFSHKYICLCYTIRVLVTDLDFSIPSTNFDSANPFEGVEAVFFFSLRTTFFYISFLFDTLICIEKYPNCTMCTLEIQCIFSSSSSQ